MEKLENQELIEVSGGAGAQNTDTIKVMLVFKGDVEARKHEIKSVKVRCWDDSGMAYGTLTPANDWTCKFRVLHKAEFDTDVDFSAYPFVTKATQDWNQKANLMIYYVS